MKLPNARPDYGYVIIQFLLFAAYLFPVGLDSLTLPDWLRYSGLIIMGPGILLGIISFLQLNKNLSPFPTPLKKSKLITTGAYAICRHPVYTALIALTFGYAVYRASAFKMFIASLLLTLFYFKSGYEEKLLSQKFPEYEEYKKKTRPFI